MKKSLYIILSALILLTGCQSQTDIVSLSKNYWNATIEQVFDAFGVTESDVEYLSEGEGESGKHYTYEFKRVKIGDTYCDLMLDFKGYPGCDPGLCSMTFLFSKKKQKQAEKLYSKLTSDVEWIETEHFGGYGNVGSINQDADWLMRYANIYLGDTGYYVGDSRVQNGSVVRMPEPPSYFEECPLIKVEWQNGANRTGIYLNSDILCILGQKAGLEALYPDGMPIYHE